MYIARYRNKFLGGYTTAEEAAYAYDQYTIERNIKAGYDRHRLNFIKAKTKRPREQDNQRADTPEV